MAYFYKYVNYGSSRNEGEFEKLISNDDIQLEKFGDGEGDNAEENREDK